MLYKLTSFINPIEWKYFFGARLSLKNYYFPKKDCNESGAENRQELHLRSFSNIIFFCAFSLNRDNLHSKAL